jgi:hypothetical protein
LNAAVYQLPTAIGSNGQILGVNAGTLQFVDNTADGVQTLTAANDSIQVTGTAANPIIEVNTDLSITSITAEAINAVDSNSNALFSLPLGGIPQDSKNYCIASSGVNGETQLVWQQVGAGSGAVDSLTNTDNNITLSSSTGDITVNLANVITITGDITAHSLVVTGDNGNGYIMPPELIRTGNPAQCIAFIDGLEDLQFTQFVGEITNNDNNLLLTVTEPTVDISLKDSMTISGTFKSTTALQSKSIGVLDDSDIVMYTLPTNSSALNDVIRFTDTGAQWTQEITYTCPDSSLTIAGTAPNKTIAVTQSTLSSLTFNVYLEDTTGAQTQVYLDSGKTVAFQMTGSITYGSNQIPYFQINMEEAGKWYRDAGAGNFMALVLKTTIAEDLLMIGEMAKGSMRISDYGVAATPAFVSSEILMCAYVYDSFTGIISLKFFSENDAGILQNSDDHFIGLNTTAGHNLISSIVLL